MDQKTLVFLLIACLLCVSSSAALSMISTSGEDESTPEDENTPGSVPSTVSVPSTSDRINAAAARREAEENEPSVTMVSGGKSIKTSSDENNDCTGAWGDWGDCTQECSYEGSKGEKVRIYSVEWPATGEGKACPYDDGEEEVRECGKIKCTPKDCVGNWTAWSVEGVGENAIEKRSWDVTQEPKYGGAECSVEESARMETRAATASTPSVDCVGRWVNVGMCSETCGPNGKQKRRYEVTTAASGPNGKSCMDSVGLLLKDGDIDNTQPCNTDVTCSVDCAGNWGDWSECNPDCKTNEIERTYYVTTPAVGTGNKCEYKDGDKEKKECLNCPEGKKRIKVQMWDSYDFQGNEVYGLDLLADKNEPKNFTYKPSGDIGSIKISEGVRIRTTQRYRRGNSSRTRYVTIYGPAEIKDTSNKNNGEHGPESSRFKGTTGNYYNLSGANKRTCSRRCYALNQEMEIQVGPDTGSV